MPFCHFILKASKPKVSKVLTKAPKNPITLGDKIKKRRIELGMFQKELAEMIGVTEDTIRNWEKDRSIPSKSLKVLILDILKIAIYK